MDKDVLCWSIIHNLNTRKNKIRRKIRQSICVMKWDNKNKQQLQIGETNDVGSSLGTMNCAHFTYARHILSTIKINSPDKYTNDWLFCKEKMDCFVVGADGICDKGIFC